MLALPASAHISLEQKIATVGSAYKAVFEVSHGCNGSATTALAVQIPAGFQGAKPYPKAGWTLAIKRAKLAKPYVSHGKQIIEGVVLVTWTAAHKEAALQDAFIDEFALRGTLFDTTGPMWFKVLQTCESGSTHWNEVPSSGTSAKDLKTPAPMLDVVASSAVAEVTSPASPVQVSNAWVRLAVPGQSGTGAFMTLTAKSATRLTRITSPVAGQAEVHEMKMEGDVMKMRSLTGLDLPAGKSVELRSGSYHLMLTDLKQALLSGSTVPMTLVFKNAAGVESSVNLKLPVAAVAPTPVGTASTGEKSQSAQQH